MKISFIMPLPTSKPVGGFRIVYEYADRLSQRGHQVTVYYPIQVPILKYRSPFWLRYLRNIIKGRSIARWFDFKSDVSLRIIPSIRDAYIQDGDAVIATAVPTAYEVGALRPEKGVKFYLIQHYEVWDGIEAANKSYRLGLKNIVIAKWLESKLEEIGAAVAGYIPNAIDSSKFKVTCAAEKRDKFSVASIYHVDPYKGSNDAIESFRIVKNRYPQLKCLLFGVFARPRWLPSWIEYVYNPSQRGIVDIYNNTAIFVSSSISEGFGLPGLEALACGCSLVSTDSLGVREYALHDRTALLSEPRRPEKLAANIMDLIDDDAKRLALARQGHDYVARYSWDTSVDTFERLLKNG